jgi:ferredoxin
VFSILRTIWYVFLHSFQKRVTVQYPEEKPYLAPRYRGRIILSRDPDGGERCVACNLCAVACPVDCIALVEAADADQRTNLALAAPRAAEARRRFEAHTERVDARARAAESRRQERQARRRQRDPQ